ncbi:MAG: hypothetical protein WCH34_00915 [Bacteroidota bacterium]
MKKTIQNPGIQNEIVKKYLMPVLLILLPFFALLSSKWHFAIFLSIGFASTLFAFIFYYLISGIINYKKSYLHYLKLTIIVLSSLAIIWPSFFYGSSNSSSFNKYSSSNSNENSSEKTCTWCGKKYTGDGYNHLGGAGSESYCATASNGWEKENQCCSLKCCEEQWASNH